MFSSIERQDISMINYQFYSKSLFSKLVLQGNEPAMYAQAVDGHRGRHSVYIYIYLLWPSGCLFVIKKTWMYDFCKESQYKTFWTIIGKYTFEQRED